MKLVFLLLLLFSSVCTFSQVNGSVHGNRPHPGLKPLDRSSAGVGKTNVTPASPTTASRRGIRLTSTQIKSLTAAGGLHYGHKALLYGDHLAMSKALSANSLGVITEKKALTLLAAGKKLALKSPAKMFTLGVTAVGGYYVIKDWLAETPDSKTTSNSVSIQK